jgi:hypothetical protein
MNLSAKNLIYLLEKNGFFFKEPTVVTIYFSIL